MSIILRSVKLSLFLTFNLYSVFVFGYGLSGLWQGAGTLKIAGQDQVYDCVMLLDIQHTADFFLVKKSDFDCKVMHIKNKAAQKLVIYEGLLYVNDLVYGQIDEAKMLSEMLYPDGRHQSYLMKKETSLKMIYTDSIDWGKGLETSIHGELYLSIKSDN